MEDYDQVMAVNVRAVVEACLLSAKEMKDFGRIITIGSNLAERVGAPNGTLYAMSKSALTALTKGLARDLGHRNITVNLIQPGPVDTDMNPESAARAAVNKSRMAIPEYGKPQHIADLVSYLVNPATQYTTGAVITIDGGSTC